MKEREKLLLIAAEIRNKASRLLQGSRQFMQHAENVETVAGGDSEHRMKVYLQCILQECPEYRALVEQEPIN